MTASSGIKYYYIISRLIQRTKCSCDKIYVMSFDECVPCASVALGAYKSIGRKKLQILLLMYIIVLYNQV